MSDARVIAASCALAALAGCAPAVVHLEPAPASVKVVQWRGVEATVEALRKKPYLRLTEVAPQKALAARAGKAPAEVGEAAVAGVRRDVVKARELYRKLRFDEAISLLRKARGILGRHAARAEHYRLLAELALQLGLNHLALKDEAAARRAIVTASLHGYVGPAPGALPPEAEAFIAATRKGMEGQTMGGVSVKTQPPGAEVLLDGKAVGRSPVTARAAAGLHHLLVRRVGFEDRALYQEVSPGKVEQAEIYLKPAPAALAARQLLQLHGREGDPTVAPRAVREAFGPGTALLLAGEKDGKPHAHLLWTGGESAALAQHRCPGSAPASLADCLGPVLYRVAAGKPYRKRTVSTPVYKRWWFWALIGGGVAAATGTALGVYYGTKPSDNTDVYLEPQKN